MIKIIITGFEKKIGPGDIVGAFINECGVASDDIGKINISNNKAEVELAEKVAARVIERMDDNQIGGVNVSVTPANPERVMAPDLVEYIKRMKQDVTGEREEVTERYRLQLKHFDSHTRKKRGQAITGLRGRKNGSYFDNRDLLLLYSAEPGRELPETLIGEGDMVLINSGGQGEDEAVTAEVIEMSPYYYLTALNSGLPDFSADTRFTIDLYYSEDVYRRREEAVLACREISGSARRLRDVMLLGRDQPGWLKQEIRIRNWDNGDLLPEQKSAVQKALNCRDYFLLDGGPGTGRTETVIEIIRQSVKKGEQVLAVAKNRRVLDLIAEKLRASGIKITRAGYPGRDTEFHRKTRLVNQVLEEKEYLEARRLEIQALDLEVEKENLAAGQESAGVNLNRREVQLRFQERLEVLQERIFDKKRAAVNSLLEEARVVLATPGEISAEFFQERHFDFLVVDDANLIKETAVLPALLKVKRAVLAADSRRSSSKSSLLARLLQEQSQDFCQQLRIQHRLPEAIMGYINSHFSGDKNCAGSMLANHRKKKSLFPEDRAGEAATPEEKAILGEESLVFLDTRNLLAAEKQHSESDSYFNPVEAEIAADLIYTGEKSGLKSTRIGAMTFCQDQCRYLNQMGFSREVLISTVAGYQGLERDVMIVSLVRSNRKNYLGCLKDSDLLLTALTRAKMKLILIGDSETLKSGESYSSLIDYSRDRGLYLVI